MRVLHWRTIFHTFYIQFDQSQISKHDSKKQGCFPFVLLVLDMILFCCYKELGKWLCLPILENISYWVAVWCYSTNLYPQLKFCSTGDSDNEGVMGKNKEQMEMEIREKDA